MDLNLAQSLLEDRNEMDVEKVLQNVGEFGLYQKLLCLVFISYTTFICGVNYYTQIFIFATPTHTCGNQQVLNRTESYKDDIPDCPDGWVYNHSIIFPTITSQVHYMKTRE